MKVKCPRCKQKYEAQPYEIRNNELCGKCAEIEESRKPQSEEKVESQQASKEQAIESCIEKIDNLEQLQSAVDYYLLTKIINTPLPYTIGGSMGIIFMASILLSSKNISLLHFLLIIVPGIVVFTTGLFTFWRPSVKGLLAQGITLMVVSPYCFIIGINYLMKWHEASQKSLPSSGPALNTSFLIVYLVAGGAAFVWGCLHFLKYPQFRNVCIEEPSDNELEEVKKLVTEIVSANPKKTSNMIQFQIRTFRGNLTGNKGMLLKNGAIFMLVGGEYIFSAKEHIWINIIKESRSGKKYKVQFKIKNKSFEGNISKTFLDRYNQWKKI